jgi:hypothetical protein
MIMIIVRGVTVVCGFVIHLKNSPYRAFLIVDG